jgi:tocopherol O-methyltransferase
MLTLLYRLPATATKKTVGGKMEAQSPSQHGIVSVAQVASHYDELDSFYRELWGDHLHHGLWFGRGQSVEQAVKALVDVLVQKVGLKRGEKVLDVGCGYGATARLLADEFGAEVTGYTVSMRQHAYAVANHGSAAKFHLRDWLTADLVAESADVVIAIESTEHMASLEKFLKQARHALKKGGRIAVCAWNTVPNPGTWSNKYLLQPICREGRMVAMRTAADFTQALNAYGFHSVEVQDFTSAAKQTWHIAVRRTLTNLWRPEYRKYLLSRESRNRDFVRAILRLLVAYETGQMRYEVVSAVAG